MKNVENAVKNFKREFNIRNVPDLEDLKSIIKEMNYRLLTYQKNEALLEKMKLTQRSKFTPSVSCINKSGSYLFYNGNILPNDLPFVLAHEIGHIYMNHLKRYSGFFDTPEHKDEEAFRFAVQLLSPTAYSCKTTVFALALTTAATFTVSSVLQKRINLKRKI